MLAKPEKDDRLFAPFPIEMDEHPKIMPLSDAAFRAVFEATFYSRRMLSDGFLDERVVLKRWGAEVAEELSTNDPERPSWVRVESPRPGWVIHDFGRHHPLRAEIEARRSDLSEKRAAAGRKGGRANRKQTGSKKEAKRSPESESESETRLTPTESVGLGSNSAREDSTDSKENDDAARRLGTARGIDVDRLVEVVAEQLDRRITPMCGFRLAVDVLDRAGTAPRSPMRYVLGAITKSPFEVQQWIDREGMK